MGYTRYANWHEQIVFSTGPQPRALVENENFKAVLVGLEPGQKISPHPEGAAVYYFLEGTGWMSVDDETFFVNAGAIVVTGRGAKRGLAAETRLAFLAARAMDGVPDKGSSAR